MLSRAANELLVELSADPRMDTLPVNGRVKEVRELGEAGLVLVNKGRSKATLSKAGRWCMTKGKVA